MEKKSNALLEWIKPYLIKRASLNEILFFLVFLILYKVSRFIAIGTEATAFANAYLVIEIEKAMGIFYEIPVQQYFLPFEELVKFMNQVYMRLHMPSSIIFFVWLFRSHREYYWKVRNVFVVANIMTLFFYIGFPTAPPRMLNEIGFVDTLLSYSHINLYSGNLAKLFNQYAAVPSMHFGMSVLICIILFQLVKSNWIKWGVMIYPLFVLLVITITGNHYFIDAILGGLIVIIAFPLLKLYEVTLAPRINIKDLFRAKSRSTDT